MNKFLLTCCLLIATTAICRAQTFVGLSPEDMVKKLNSELHLSDYQTIRIFAIYNDEYAKVDSLRKVYRPGDVTGIRLIRTLLQASQDKVKAILNAQQLIEWQEATKQRQTDMMRHGGN